MPKKQAVMILDCNFLCWRAFHTMGGLSYQGDPTGAIFGFFKTLSDLENTLGTGNFVFCWDMGKKTVRHELLPTYKEKRHSKELDKDEYRKIKDLRVQMKTLRDTVLPSLGFKNVMKAKGFEADDLIAAACTRLTLRGHKCVIVSADKDLYQLLSDNVSMWNPTTKKATTRDSFAEEWGLEPVSWIGIKSIAGCSTDDIPGVKGVGEKTAAKFLRKELKEGSSSDQAIREFVKSPKYMRNWKLVKLPFVNTPSKKIDPVPPAIDSRKWYDFCEEYGFESLKSRVPGSKTGFGLIPKRRK